MLEMETVHFSVALSSTNKSTQYQNEKNRDNLLSGLPYKVTVIKNKLFIFYTLTKHLFLEEGL